MSAVPHRAKVVILVHSTGQPDLFIAGEPRALLGVVLIGLISPRGRGVQVVVTDRAATGERLLVYDLAVRYFVNESEVCCSGWHAAILRRRETRPSRAYRIYLGVRAAEKAALQLHVIMEVATRLSSLANSGVVDHALSLGEDAPIDQLDAGGLALERRDPRIPNGVTRTVRAAGSARSTGRSALLTAREAHPR